MRGRPVTAEQRRRLAAIGLVTFAIGLVALPLSWAGARGELLGFVGIALALVGMLMLVAAWLARADREGR